MTEDYDSVIKQQRERGIVEPANDKPIGKEYYIPHKDVVREAAQSTKLRVVYEASARASPDSPSLNDCLYAGPPLQNKLWEILVRTPFQWQSPATWGKRFSKSVLKNVKEMRQDFIGEQVH